MKLPGCMSCFDLFAGWNPLFHPLQKHCAKDDLVITQQKILSPKINMSLKRGQFQRDISFSNHNFQGILIFRYFVCCFSHFSSFPSRLLMPHSFLPLIHVPLATRWARNGGTVSPKRVPHHARSQYLEWKKRSAWGIDRWVAFFSEVELCYFWRGLVLIENLPRWWHFSLSFSQGPRSRFLS